MIKLGISSYSFAAYMKATGASYFDICDKAKEIGFESIEFITLKTEEDTNESRLALADGLREHCAAIGLEISAYTVGANLAGKDGDKTVEDLLHSLEVTRRLGASIMRHDVFSSSSPDVDYKAVIGEVVPRIRRVADKAREMGIVTCAENHGYVFQAPERVRELIVAVDRPNYRWLCDVGNFMCADCDTVESVKIAAPYTCHVHAKDFLCKARGEMGASGFNFSTIGGNRIRGTVIGHGVVRVGECLKVLLESGYDGYISLEFEGKEDPIYALTCGYENLRELCGLN